MIGVPTDVCSSACITRAGCVVWVVWPISSRNGGPAFDGYYCVGCQGCSQSVSHEGRGGGLEVGAAQPLRDSCFRVKYGRE